MKDLLNPIVSVESDEAAIRAAEVLRKTFDARLTTLLVGLLPDPIYLADAGAASAIWADVLAQVREDLRAEKARLEKRSQQGALPFKTRVMEAFLGALETDIAVQARHADMTILVRPHNGGEDRSRAVMFEAALFGSGRPVLAVPPNWNGSSIGQTIVVAWNGSREAARALADAMPLLKRAKKILIVTVDAQPKQDGVGPMPGVDIADHLASHGLSVEVRNLDGGGQLEGAVLLAECAAIDADLLVMGGYGTPRLAEMVFGGATRNMIETAHVPVFMSH